MLESHDETKAIQKPKTAAFPGSLSFTRSLFLERLFYFFSSFFFTNLISFLQAVFPWPEGDCSCGVALDMTEANGRGSAANTVEWRPTSIFIFFCSLPGLIASENLEFPALWALGPGSTFQDSPGIVTELDGQRPRHLLARSCKPSSRQ